MKIYSFFEHNKQLVFKLLAYIVFVTFSVISISIIACNVSPSQIMILSGDYTTPKLDSWKMAKADVVDLYFTRSVIFPDLKVFQISKDDTVAVVSEITASLKEIEMTSENKTLCLPIKLSEPTVVGTQYLLVGTALDEHENTVDFTLSFSGYNSLVPSIIFSEVRTEYSKTKSSTKVEYVEFVVLSDGNTAGMEFVSAYDGEEKMYTFPYLQVHTGDYIVLHMRQLDETAINEIGDDLLLSTAKDSSDARDLWIENEFARIGKDDVLTLRDRENGKILDAVMFSRSGKEEWAKDSMTNVAKEVYNTGIWSDGYLPESVICSDGVTLTRTLSRQNIEECIALYAQGDLQPYAVTATNWYIVDTSCASPGEPNSDNPYTE